MFDPQAHTAAQVNVYLETVDAGERERVLDREVDTLRRVEVLRLWGRHDPTTDGCCADPDRE